MPFRIILAQPRGFCAGVDRAITIVERALELYGAPVFVRHEIVHNRYVVESLKKKGAVFVQEIDDIPDGAITIFSAHGVSQKVEDAAAQRNLPTIDATCPLVKKVHKEAQSFAAEGRQVILIGHAGHPEVEGTSGRIKEVLLVSNVQDADNLVVKNPDLLAYVTQTTLSVMDTREILDRLKKRFPTIKGPDLRNICYATQNRQDAVAKLAEKVDLLLVVGGKNSSNSNRLRDLGEKMNTASYLIGSAEDIAEKWLEGISVVGITAGASAPEILVEKVIARLQNLRKDAIIETMAGTPENIRFKLPKEVLEPVPVK